MAEGVGVLAGDVGEADMAAVVGIEVKMEMRNGLRKGGRERQDR